MKNEKMKSLDVAGLIELTAQDATDVNGGGMCATIGACFGIAIGACVGGPAGALAGELIGAAVGGAMDS